MIDHILFNDELELLLIRMRIMQPYVNEFRIYESAYTFTGKQKRFVAWDNMNRFDEIESDVTVIRNSDLPHRNPWVNEKRTRNRIEVEPGEINILSDVDEIPSRSVLAMIQKMPLDSFPIVNYQDHYYYDIFTKWQDPIATTVFFLKSNNIQRMRKIRRRFTKVYGGWHFSCFGGADKLEKKLGDFAHTELNITRPEIEYALQHGTDIVRNRGYDRLVRLSSWRNEDLPDYVCTPENMDYLIGNF